MSFWLKRALARATSRPSPDRIPLSTPRVFGRDYYSATLGAPDESWSILFSRLDGNTVYGRRLEGDSYSDEVVGQPLSGFSDATVEFRYYLRQYEFVSRSAFRFEIASLTRLYRAKASFEDFRQHLYNRKSLVLQDRHKLLRDLVEKTVEDRDASFSAVTLVSEIYGRMVVNHPLFLSRVNHYRLLLDSLAAEGLLTQANLSYRLEPRALTALNAYDDEERRHTDSAKTQRRMMWLALFSGVAAAAQAESTLTKWWSSISSWLQSLL